MEDMADLAEMRQLLMGRVKEVMAICCQFGDSLESYRYLYVDDRKELMRHFLLYGRGSHETGGYSDDCLCESPPTLDHFREQVDQ